MSVIAGSSPMITVLGVVVIGLMALCIYFINKLNATKRFGYLTLMLARCTQETKPLGLLVDKSGNVIPFVIERDEKNRGLVKHDTLTLIHPDLAMASVTRMKLKNGPDMIIYPMPYFFPFSVHSAAALSQVAENIRHDPDLNWMPSELRIIELLFNGTETFERDARMAIREAVVNGYPVPESWYPVDEDEEEEIEEVEEEEEESQFGDDEE